MKRESFGLSSLVRERKKKRGRECKRVFETDQLQWKESFGLESLVRENERKK